MVNDLVKLSSRFVIELALLTRLDMSLVTMLPTMIPCSAKCGKVWIAKKRWISKAPFYSPESPDLIVGETNGHQDEIGLVQAIVVKARSSAQRKQLFLDIQRCPPNPCPETEVMQLLLDMPIRWSSTYVMIDRAEKKKVFSSPLLKSDQMVQIKLTADEWRCVELFASLLAVWIFIAPLISY
ncbi:hypothetical protein BU15DRAFT_63719 [Melanogaster broomeanus]|nr:hypothetical protein BU15DRAFT_63719 [Melanogaster broomeanus]